MCWIKLPIYFDPRVRYQYGFYELNFEHNVGRGDSLTLRMIRSDSSAWQNVECKAGAGAGTFIKFEVTEVAHLAICELDYEFGYPDRVLQAHTLIVLEDMKLEFVKFCTKGERHFHSVPAGLILVEKNKVEHIFGYW
jgi:hypothetical protein